MINRLTHLILQPGSTHANTSVTIRDGIEIADFTDCTPAEDYLVTLNAKREPGSPEFVMVPYAEGEAMLTAAQDTEYLEPWKECTEERYQEMLECLPPEKWERVQGVSIFRMCEYYTSDITRHFASYLGRYFEGRFRTSGASYEEHAAEIRNKARLFIGGYPAGIVYADRGREKSGDYARLAFLPYHTLKLDVETDCPPELRTLIEAHAALHKAGDVILVSASQTITLGGAAQ